MLFWNKKNVYPLNTDFFFFLPMTHYLYWAYNYKAARKSLGTLRELYIIGETIDNKHATKCKGGIIYGCESAGKNQLKY